MDELLKRIEALEKELKTLKSNSQLFGRSYSQIGSSDSDLLMKTRGQVKIQWGSKFIDLIKDGKINADSKFIYVEDSVGDKDGIYVVNESVILVANGEQIGLGSSEGNTYVSFLEAQTTTPEQKYTALQNIGFIYKDLDSVNESALQNGIVYIESEQKLYIITNGKVSQFNILFPNPFTEQFVIAKSDTKDGAIVIQGSGESNSLSFNSLKIYTEGSDAFIKSDGIINFNSWLAIDQDESQFSNRIVTNTIQSSNNSFRLYVVSDVSTLEINNITCDNLVSNEISIPELVVEGPITGNSLTYGTTNVETKFNEVSIYKFDGIQQSLPSGTALTTVGVASENKIIYIRDKKKFYCVTESGDYYNSFDRQNEYNDVKSPYTDRNYRWNNDLYKYDTEAYISKYSGLGKDEYGADLVCVTDAGKALFIKMWREAICRPLTVAASNGMVVWDSATDELGNIPISDYGGYYPEWHETPGFFINGINGISYAEARQIYEARTYGSYPRQLRDVGNVRTNMLCCYDYNTGGGQDGRGINTPFAFVGYGTTVVRVAAGLRGQRPTGSCWLRGSLNFYDVPELVEVIGAVQLGTLGDNALSFLAAPFPKLQYLWITELSVSLTKTFAGTPNINVDCLRYLVEKSRATAAKPISVTLHADVFAALPEDILTLAETKYVTFVSAT